MVNKIREMTFKAGSCVENRLSAFVERRCAGEIIKFYYKSNETTVIYTHFTD